MTISIAEQPLNRLATASRSRSRYVSWKPAADMVLASLFMVAATPVMVIAMAIVRLTSRGPALYTQERLGQGGRRFTIYKIRSMYRDSEARTGALWCAVDDPRVTPIGRFLRRTHLDELPQLWNVLRGEMSLVGPRPERPEIAERLEQAIPRYRERLSVRPGLTGLAQVELPPDTDLESVRRKLERDLNYIERIGLGLDLGILLRTFGLVGREAMPRRRQVAATAS